MKVFAAVLGIFAGVLAAWFLLTAFLTPIGIGGLTTASAIQVTQVYTQALYNVGLAIAFLLIAGICLVGARASPAALPLSAPAYACPQCHAPAVAGQRYCAQCAYDFDPPAPATPRRQRPVRAPDPAE